MCVGGGNGGGEASGGSGWHGGFMYASYWEKGSSPKSYVCVEGEWGLKSRTELRKYFIEDPSC